ncbi:MAG TPA: VCBS repeat-containing protein [Gemmatimonadaceae bacterium]|nr:VCBS repeat-containing protein [Gemmatimonadaceae bacterium]
MIRSWRSRGILAALCATIGCRSEGPPASPPLFDLLAPDSTGVTFVNRLPEDTAFNILNYLYYYNGGGVAVGDVDNDGLPDLYFSANVGPNRLYRNLGNYRFEDITDRAGVAGPPGWKTGVTMADVTGDGRVDIYVSAVNHLSMRGRNVLYVNNGDGTFTDRTNELGLEYAGYSTQAVFFDYDNDGDLDLYLLNHATHADRKFGGSRRADVYARNPRIGDRLYRNDRGHFTDVSQRAGIYGGVDFGLGVVASDLNGDGCMDLYVANDFQEDDLLYYNNCDGTFTESLAKSMGHTSRFSMGVDAADFNNDLRPDIAAADMLPQREEILKASATSESVELFNLKAAAGYHPQYARNTLQLNRGVRPAAGGRGVPTALFSDVGYLAGVSATDWSWSPLFVDLDNDGRKDLFIADGVYRRPNDMDYIAYISNGVVQASLASGINATNLSLVDHMPSVALANHAYRNEGGLHFTDVATQWGLAQPGFSNGAAYVDLNNSGALDLVVNRINAPAAIYRNNARRRNGNHYMQVRLRGATSGTNSGGIGAKVIVRQGTSVQLLEQMPTRGYQSSVDPRLHFGLGTSARIDSLIVVWPDRRSQVLTGVQGDRTITLWQDSANVSARRVRGGRAPLFADVTSQVGLAFKHAENDYRDYDREPLIPRLLSTEGPALAVGDVNGDGLDDVYVGGAKWQSGRLFVQQSDGTFRKRDENAFAADSLAEDVDAAFVDANGDGHPDLYVVSGGNEFLGDDEALQDRLYLNDGRGHFRRDRAALPRLRESGSCVAVGDVNGDGSPDLFVGRRSVSGSYGTTPTSYLLLNDGKGHFRDVAAESSPDLSNAGMVSSAAWLDYDGDGKLDLVVVGEWMPVRVFHQENGRLADRTSQVGLAGSNGWWSTVSASDVNGDGRPDLVLGNLGLNSYIRASQYEPARLYVHDFAKNGTLQQILTFYKNGVSYPVAGRDEVVRQNPSLRSRYPTYASFGASRVEDIFPAADLRDAKVLEANTFGSAIALSRDGRFDLRPLPVEAQLAPINATLTGDFDGDGVQDLLVAGNFFGVPPIVGRFDASHGLLLHGTRTATINFTPVDLQESNLFIEGQVRHMKWLRTVNGRSLIVVARNNDSLKVLRPLHAKVQ